MERKRKGIIDVGKEGNFAYARKIATEIIREYQLEDDAKLEAFLLEMNRTMKVDYFYLDYLPELAFSGSAISPYVMVELIFLLDNFLPVYQKLKEKANLELFITSLELVKVAFERKIDLQKIQKSFKKD